ncbi:MAG: nucleotidyltransferase [Terriglobia bacterium]|jgi:hypothetical protein
MDTENVLFTENAEAQLDDLLWRICEEVQLPPTRYEQAVARYEAVSEWLEREGSALRDLSPSIYPQGSMRIGTTVKPLGREEHDLDFVCEFQARSNSFKSPHQLIASLALRIRQHETYASIVELKNRCVRLNYANEFHMDILPAYRDPLAGANCLVVPDRRSACWKPSNPKGYAKWFEQRCDLATASKVTRLLARAEPIPLQQGLNEKETLKKAVQLLKRWRDIRFQHKPDLAPISMVLTTLAADRYTGEISLAKALTGILKGIFSQIDTCRPRIYVLNPGNPLEDLSERWDEEKKYRAFVEGITELDDAWETIVRTRSVPRLSQLLEDLFGAPTQVALAKQARRLQELRENSNLRIGAAGLISNSLTAGVHVRKNTFHGEK